MHECRVGTLWAAQPALGRDGGRCRASGNTAPSSPPPLKGKCQNFVRTFIPIVRGVALVTA